jgi:Asp-tRNA(Asn)/Glu-tRNA(Gln) amidotransferase A subunit family amidase
LKTFLERKNKVKATDLVFMTAAELTSAVRKKTLSPTEVVEAVLARIEKVNPKVNAYCTVAGGMAREAAKKAEAEVMRGGERAGVH